MRGFFIVIRTGFKPVTYSLEGCRYYSTELPDQVIRERPTRFERVHLRSIKNRSYPWDSGVLNQLN